MLKREVEFSLVDGTEAWGFVLRIWIHESKQRVLAGQAVGRICIKNGLERKRGGGDRSVCPSGLWCWGHGPYLQYTHNLP